MAQEVELLKAVCQKLNQAGIAYMLTGSVAAHFYAVPRMTRDIDIVIEILNSEVDLFFQFFHADFYVDKGSVIEAIKYNGMFNIIHEDSCFKIDFIIRKESFYRNVEFQRRKKIELDGMQIWIVSPEDLILSKLDWAKDSLSEIQIKDVRNLLLSINCLDKGYIDKWVRLLKIDEVYKMVRICE